MTRNTKCYSVTFNNLKVIYKDLTIKEVDFLKNITNEITKNEFSAKLAIIEPTDTSIIPYGVLLQVGNNAFKNSNKVAFDDVLFEITVKEYRDKIETESSLALIGEIIKIIPGQSITDLMNLTYNDLIEIACLCETITGKQILKVNLSKRKGTKLVNTSELPDGGKSLQQKMDEVTSFIRNK